MFLGRIKGNIDPKWVKHYNIGESGIIWFEFDTWNASSLIVKQNDCKNKQLG